MFMSVYAVVTIKKLSMKKKKGGGGGEGIKKKNEEKTLRPLTFKCNIENNCFCLLNAHQSQKAYCIQYF